MNIQTSKSQHMNSHFDIAIIGAGCVGSAIAQRLCQYNLKIALVEKEEDVAMGATKANSGIIHPGYFIPEGSMKEKMNLRGSPMFEEVCQNIGVDFARPGAIFCATSNQEKETLKNELKRARDRYIPVELIEDPTLIRVIEPSLKDNVIAILFFPTAGIIIPFELTIGLAEHAILNGTQLFLGFEVVKILRENNEFTITSATGDQITSKFVINAGGLYADKIAEMVGISEFFIIPRIGEYILFDKDALPLKRIIFPTPSKESKGILISPTLHHNVFIGPNAHEIQNKEETITSTAGLNEIIINAQKLVKDIPMKQAITNFAGIRATPSTHDFIIGLTKIPNFLNAAGIESPGLSSCLAIAEHIQTILKYECRVTLNRKENYIPQRKKHNRFLEQSESQLSEKILHNPNWGQIVCRCEFVTQAEIIDACHAIIPCTNTDMIKRRLRPGMGRCQGGFCLPKVMKIIAQEKKVDLEEITMKGNNSYIITGKTKNIAGNVIPK